MKKQSSELFTALSVEEKENLAMEVEETLAAGFNLPRQKTFTPAELWNIQRQRKAVVQRRFLF